MRAFVSGGAGFVGSHLVPALLRRADVDTVVVYDNLTSGTRAHLDAMGSDGVEFIHGDIKALPDLTAAMRGTDVVFHLAAKPDISKAVTQPDIDFWEGTVPRSERRRGRARQRRQTPVLHVGQRRIR